MLYYIIAGEASGDMHGANLMKAILAKDAQAKFRFWGGDKMAKVPNSIQIEHYKNTAFMGFVEVVKHLPQIFSYLKKCKEDIRQSKPDVVVFIDYPGFNIRIAPFVKELGIKTVYYISPQVWAWKESRVKKIKKYIDKMLVILPFEKAFYQKHNFEVEFVGHPLIDELSNYQNNEQIQSERKIIALLPGSRQQEIEKILPVMLSVVNEFSSYQFVIAGLNHIPLAVYQKIIGKQQVEIVQNQTYDLLHKSHAALVASGTATLETALFNVPMVVTYIGNFLSYCIGRLLVKIDFIALVNLIRGKKVVEELIQNDCNPQNLKTKLRIILEGEERVKMLEEFKQLRKDLGNQGASNKAAQSIIQLIK